MPDARRPASGSTVVAIEARVIVASIETYLKHAVISRLPLRLAPRGLAVSSWPLDPGDYGPFMELPDRQATRRVPKAAALVGPGSTDEFATTEKLGTNLAARAQNCNAARDSTHRGR
jgi:hypothetical protein